MCEDYMDTKVKNRRERIGGFFVYEGKKVEITDNLCWTAAAKSAILQMKYEDSVKSLLKK